MIKMRLAKAYTYSLIDSITIIFSIIFLKKIFCSVGGWPYVDVPHTHRDQDQIGYRSRGTGWITSLFTFWFWARVPEVWTFGLTYRLPSPTVPSLRPCWSADWSFD